jgi:hypothetical protein
MLPTESIFRCMPQALHISLRRLMSGLGYAYDAAEFHYERMTEAAKAFFHPEGKAEARYMGWSPERRLSVIADAWACIDNLNRCLRLVNRFSYGDPRPEMVDPFLAAVKPAKLIRDRIQHLEEDFSSGENCEKGHPVFGTVAWIDTRYPGGFLRFFISSGPTIEKGLITSYQFTGDEHLASDVDRFSLMAFDQTVSLTELMVLTRKFMQSFEGIVRAAIFNAIRTAAADRGASLEHVGRNALTDMVSALAFRKEGENQYKWVVEDSYSRVEIPLGVLDLAPESRQTSLP